MHGRLLALAAVVALAAPVAALATAARSGKLEASLRGSAEVPKGAAGGAGEATITFSGTKVCWRIQVRGIGIPVAAHIHKGRPGTSGPVVVPLGAKYKPSGCVASTASVVRAIQARPSSYYVNVHTPKYPNGAVRGQLRADT